MFLDYLNFNPHLFDGIPIEENTIYFILDEFQLYYVFTDEFYFNFRKELKKNLMYYYKLLANEMREEVFNISTNTRFRKFCRGIAKQNFEKKYQQAFQRANNKTDTTDNFTNDNTSSTNGQQHGGITRDGNKNGTTTDSGTATTDTQDTENGTTSTSGTDSSSETSTGSTNNENKKANRQAPMSAIGDGDFEDLFEDWETASQIDEDTSDSTTRNTTTKSGTTSNNGSNNVNKHRFESTATNNTTQEGEITHDTEVNNSSSSSSTTNHEHGGNIGSVDFESKSKNIARQDACNTARDFEKYNIKDEEVNQQAVDSINKIIDYIWKENKAKDFLIYKLKKCFVNIY